MGQEDVYKFLMDNADRQFTIKELVAHFKIGQSNMARIVRKMDKYKEVKITVDGKKFLIKVRTEEE